MEDNWIYIGKHKYVLILILKTEAAQVIDFFLLENHFTLLSQISMSLMTGQRKELGHQQP